MKQLDLWSIGPGGKVCNEIYWRIFLTYRIGDWTYPNTDALGLDEYLYWCEDMEMTPVLAVWSGLTLGGGVISGSSLDPYVDDILNELEVSTQFDVFIEELENG